MAKQYSATITSVAVIYLHEGRKVNGLWAALSGAQCERQEITLASRTFTARRVADLNAQVVAYNTIELPQETQAGLAAHGIDQHEQDAQGHRLVIVDVTYTRND